MSKFRIDDRRTSSSSSAISLKVNTDDFPFEISEYDGSEFRTVALLHTRSDAERILKALEEVN